MLGGLLFLNATVILHQLSPEQPQGVTVLHQLWIDRFCRGEGM